MREPRPGELKHLYSFLHSFQQTFTCLVCAGPCSEHWGVKRAQVKGFVLRMHSPWGASAWTIPLRECAEKELAREELPGKEAPTWEGEVRRAPEETQDQRLENSRGAAQGKGFQVEEVVAKAWRRDFTWHDQGRGPEWLAGSVGGGKCLEAEFCLAPEPWSKPLCSESHSPMK